MLLFIIVMDYQKLSNDTFELDKKIRFAAICDRSGEIKYGGMRGGTNSLLSPDQTKTSVLQAWNIELGFVSGGSLFECNLQVVS